MEDGGPGLADVAFFRHVLRNFLFHIASFLRPEPPLMPRLRTLRKLSARKRLRSLRCLNARKSES